MSHHTYLRNILAAVAGCLILGGSVSAQMPRRQIYSRPEIPSTEALRRLNLRLAWKTYIPCAGGRDALIRVEFHDKDLFVVARSGIVQRMNAETGKVYWRATVGKAYTIYPYVSVNHRSVYLIANAKMYGLDRETGRKKWEHDLPAGISAAPVVDEEQIFIPSSTTRLYAFLLPFVTDIDYEGTGEPKRRSAIYGTDEDDRLAQPKPSWSELTNIQLGFRPVQTSDTLFVVSPAGTALGFAKVPKEGEPTTELYSLKTEGKIRVAPGSFGEMAYIGSDDAALYAVNITTGKLRWRHTSGTSITRSPSTTAADVYVTSEREGLARIDRDSGDAVWRIPSGKRFTNANLLADRFLAANNRFVYATDHSGRLLVLDRKRGVRLSTLDTRAYRVPVVNEVTDRLYLAANDGLILCLHDRDVVDPIRHRKALEDASSPLRKVLEEKVDEPAGKEITLRDALDDLKKRYKIRYTVVERAFKAAGVEDPLEKTLKPPRTDKKPLKEHLQKLLSLVNATYQVVDQVLLIIPAKPKE